MKKLIAILSSAVMLCALTMTSYAGFKLNTQEPETEEETPAAAAMLGGWAVTEEIPACTLPEEVGTAFEKALQGYVGMDFSPVAYLGSQVVAGTNYQILCAGKPVVPNAVTGLYVVTVYADLKGGASILHVADFDLGAIEEQEEAAADTEILAGGFAAAQECEEAELPEDAAAAYHAVMDKLLGVSYVPAALLGTKVIAGTEYAFLVHAETVTAEPACYFAVAYVAAMADGTCELLKIQPLDLAEFNKN